MAPVNTWQVGTLYIQPNGPNGLFTQPGGPNTPVYPQQQTSVDYFEVTPFSELTGLFSCGCGHFVNYPTLYRDIDVTTGEAIMAVTCSVCSFLQYVLPYEDALDTVFNPVVVI